MCALKIIKAIEQLLQSTACIREKQHTSSLTASQRGKKHDTSSSSSSKVSGSSPPQVLLPKASEPEQAVIQERLSSAPVLFQTLDDSSEVQTAAASSVPDTIERAPATNVINILELFPASASVAVSSESSQIVSPVGIASVWGDQPSQIFVISEFPSKTAPPAKQDTKHFSCATPTKARRHTQPPSTPPASLHRRKSPQKPPRTGSTHREVHVAASVSVAGTIEVEEDASWTGGSRYEINKKPWKIQDWFLQGLKKKVEQH